MQQFLLMMVAVVLVEQSVVANDKLIADPIVEKAIRLQYKKPEGNITKADLENVYELNLGDTQITDAGLKDVAKLQNLEELVLENTQITDEGLKEVAKLQKLEQLLLSYTEITDAGLKDVARLQKLIKLVFWSTKVTKAGVAEFKKALPDCQIFGP